MRNSGRDIDGVLKSKGRGPRQFVHQALEVDKTMCPFAEGDENSPVFAVGYENTGNVAYNDTWAQEAGG
jgi:hypothetical protein